jgi:XTP/dITP diphosphohydrolase
MHQLLIATTSRGKLPEITAILEGLPVELYTLHDFSGVAQPDETGLTFAENARLKALYYHQATGLPTVADDSGLEIDALGGAPGVHSARFGGATYEEKFRRIYDMLAATGSRDRTARFVCALAYASGGRIAFETAGTVAGEIATEPRGAAGFGYDPIFFYPPFGCTLAEVDREKKATVSHRGKAFRTFRAHLENAP